MPQHTAGSVHACVEEFIEVLLAAIVVEMEGGENLFEAGQGNQRRSLAASE